MLQKIFKTGNCLVVPLPKGKIQTIGLQEGSEVSVTIDEDLGQIVLKPIRPQMTSANIEFAQELNDFIAHYGSTLEVLAEDC